MAGFRYVRSQPVILGFFLVDTNAMIFGMPSALFPAIAAHRLVVAHDTPEVGIDDQRRLATGAGRLEL